MKLFFGVNTSPPKQVGGEASRGSSRDIVIEEDLPPPAPPALSESTNKKNERRRRQQQQQLQSQNHHHPLYGTMITIESPVTTPKVSHVTANKRFQQQLQEQEESTSLLSPQQRRDSMPDLGDNTPDYKQSRQPFLLPPKQLRRSKDDNNDFSDHYLERDNDDENNSLSSSYSDLRTTDRSRNKQEQESLRSMLTTGTQNSVRSFITQSVASVVDATFRIPGKPSSIRDFGGTASIPNETLNLIKNIVGAGAFGLPRGVAAFANAPSALYPAAICTIAMGAIFAYYFLLMGRICYWTSAASYREAWDETVGKRRISLNGRINNIGSRCGCCDIGILGAVVPLFIVLMAGLGNLAYNMILADTTRSLLARVGVEVTRTQCLIGTIGLVLLPLCMVKRLSVLAPFSFVGSVGIGITIAVIILRYYDGSYETPTEDHNPTLYNNKTFVVEESLQPLFGNVGAIGAFSGNFLILACMNFQGFFCHYNAPRYYIELKNNTIQRFTIVTMLSFGICTVLYLILMTYGFLTFGEHSDGFLLNNYADDDDWIAVCRLLIAISLAFTYPLPFIGVRDGLLDLLMVPTERRTSNNLNVLTFILLTFFGGLAMQFTDVGMVNAVGGGALGTAVVFIFPSLMFHRVLRELEMSSSQALRKEATFAIVLMWMGIVMGGIGVYVGVQAECNG